MNLHVGTPKHSQFRSAHTLQGLVPNQSRGRIFCPLLDRCSMNRRTCQHNNHVYLPYDLLWLHNWRYFDLTPLPSIPRMGWHFHSAWTYSLDFSAFPAISRADKGFPWKCCMHTDVHRTCRPRKMMFRHQSSLYKQSIPCLFEVSPVNFGVLGTLSISL